MLFLFTAKEAEIDRLNLENQKLSDQYENQKIEVQQTQNRWSELMEAYQNDKNHMTFLENEFEQLNVKNDDLSNTCVHLSEELKISKSNLTNLKTDYNKHQKRIEDLMAVIENMSEQFETTLKKISIEYEVDKKQLIEQHENDEALITFNNNKLEETTLELNKKNNQLDMVLEENDSYQNKCLELDNRIYQNDREIFELKKMITDLNNQISQAHYELKNAKNENVTISNKLKSNVCEEEEYKILLERYSKQKQLLRLKLKALKESENNCSSLQQQVATLVNEIDASNKKSEDLVHYNEQVNTVLQYCDIELQNCYELLNKTVIKSNVQDKIIRTLRCVLTGLASLFTFDDYKVEFDFDLLNIFDSISNAVPDDNELQICLKKMITGSITILEYIINLYNKHKLSNARVIARAEVDRLVSEAVKTVELSTRDEYQKRNDELLGVIENLQNENRTLKSNISSKPIETKEVLTDLNGPVVEHLLSPDYLTMETIKNENDTLHRFLKTVQEILGLVDVVKTDDAQFRYSLSELESRVREIKNENTALKDQHAEYQKLIALSTESQIVYQNVNTQNTHVRPIEMVDNEEKRSLSLSSEDIRAKQQYDTKMPNVAESDDSKLLLGRYKNLKSRFKEVRAKTVELDKKIISLTNELERANSKYNRLNDQYVSANDNHEADIVSCQSEIETLMCEKLEAHRQLAALKEKHEILQNDYDQLKSNLDEDGSVNKTADTTPTSEQATALKRQLNDVQHLIDSAYSAVLCDWPTNDTSADWVFVQSRKLDEIVTAKRSSSNGRDYNSDSRGVTDVQRLQTCVRIIRELIAAANNGTAADGSATAREIIELTSDLKASAEAYSNTISGDRSADGRSAGNNDTVRVSERLSAGSPAIEPLASAEQTTNPPWPESDETVQFQRAIAERDRLIAFLSDKIAQLDNLNRSADDVRSIREKLDRALTVVHERDVRCDELTLELTRVHTSAVKTWRNVGAILISTFIFVS